MNLRILLLGTSLSLIAACSGSQDDEVTELSCDDSHGCPNGYSCEENQCVANDASVANDQVQATGEASGAPAVVEVETSDCKGPSCQIAAGSDVTFRAPQLEGYRFTGWGGDARCLGTEPVLALANVAANIHCVANYVKRVVIAGDSALADAAVNASSTAGFASCQPTRCEVDQGSSVEITAGDVPGHRFAGFSGSGCEGASGNRVSVVAGDADVTCTANYVVVFRVLGQVVGAAGEVAASSDTAAASCDGGSCSVDQGGAVTLTAPVLDGFRFAGWSGDATGCAGSEPVITLSDVDADVVCAATFVARFSVKSGTDGLPDARVLAASSSDAFADCAEGACDVDAGSTVQLMAPSVAGFAFKGFEGEGCDDLADLSGTTLTLNDVSGDLACLARYEALPPGKVSVTGNLAQGVPGAISASSVGGSCQSGVCVVDEGSSVALTAPDLTASNYRFTGWTGTGCSGSNLQLTLNNVQSDTVCTATYVRQYTVSFPAAANGVVTASNVTPLANAHVSSAACTLDAGGSLRLTASANANYRFVNWSGCSTSTNATLDLSNINADTSCTAHFVQQFSVTYSAGTGGTVTPAAGQCTSGSPCTVDTGTNLQLIAQASAGYRFNGWSGKLCNDTVPGTPLVADLGVTSDITCAASFVKQVIVSFPDPAGGAVAGSLATPNGSCTGATCTLDANGSVRLTATADASYRFVNWSGCSASTNAVLDLTNIATNTTCNAVFVARVKVDFPAPSNGSIAASNVPAGGSCTGASCALDAPGSLTLTASPAAGYRFVNWSGCSTSTSATLNLANINADTTCIANFVARFTVAATLAGAPTNTTVTATASAGSPQSTCTNPSPGAGNCAVDQGLSVTLTASSVANYDITGWSGGNCNLGAANANFTTLTFSNVSANFTCTPSYRARVTITLVKKPGDITNTVQVSGTGCAANASSCTVPYGSTVSLTAGTGKAGDFISWSGLECNGTTGSLSFTATQSQTCTATFSGYWAMLFSHTGTSEAYEAILPVKDSLYAFGGHNLEGRIANLEAISGDMVSDELLYTSPSANTSLSWVDAVAFNDAIVILGQISARGPSATLLGGGGSLTFMRRVVNGKVPALFEKVRDIDKLVALSGSGNAYGRTSLVALDDLGKTPSDTAVIPKYDTALQFRNDCKNTMAVYTDARGISPTQSGGYALVHATRLVSVSGLQNDIIWLVETDGKLGHVRNGYLTYTDDSGKPFMPAELIVNEVLPTPGAGGYLIVGAMRRAEDYDGLVIKIKDSLDPEWAYYFDHPSYDDALTGGTVASNGDYVLVGSTATTNDAVDGWFLRLAKDGSLVRSRAIGVPDELKGGAANERFTDVRTAPLGGLFISGSKLTPSTSTTAAWALHTDEASNVLFRAALGAHNTAANYAPKSLTLGVVSTGLCFDQTVGDVSLQSVGVTKTPTPATSERQAWDIP